MLTQAGFLTAAFALGAPAVGLLLWWVFLPYGQHTGAGDGALSVAQLRMEAAREARARAETGRHRAERTPSRVVRSEPTAWIEPVEALAA